MNTARDRLFKDIRACTACATAPPPLPVTPNPIVRGTAKAKIRIIGQAPGTLAHASSIPFDDPSGKRLRDWLGVTPHEFYNEDYFAITPMGFCFPGQDEKGSDLPPRQECAPLWQDKLTEVLDSVELTLLIGMYAQRKYLGADAKSTLTETVKTWHDYGPAIIPLPHPSWRNNGWIKKHVWFPDILAHVKVRVRDLIKP